MGQQRYKNHSCLCEVLHGLNDSGRSDAVTSSLDTILLASGCRSFASDAARVAGSPLAGVSAVLMQGGALNGRRGIVKKNSVHLTETQTVKSP